MTRLLRSLSAIFIVLSIALVAAAAQEAGGLRSLLEDLRGGIGGGEPAPALRAPSPDTSAPPRATARRVPFSDSEIQLSYAPLVERTGPSVVNVYAARLVERRSPFAGDPFFEQFFGDQFRGPPRVQSSLGSGVIVDEGGLIVTNNHVIAGADEIRVVLADGREFESRVILRDERSDLAVLRIDGGEDFTALPFGDSDDLKTGDLVLAIGNPFGVGQTITSGIVSAQARTRVGVSDFGFFIQTDAAINPGNSGGALIDMHGRLVGINTAIFSRSGGSNGIGFAIPSNMVQAVVAQARGGSDAFERPYIGARFQPVTPQIADSLGLDRPVGALIADIDPEGPAARAGLRAGDVVLAINGALIEHPDALGYRLATIGPGNTVTLRLLSRGREREVEVALIRPPEGRAPERTLISGRSPFAGATVANLSPRLAQRLDLRIERTGEGVVITDIERGAPAMRAGLRPGDVIVAINGTRIADVGDMISVTDSDRRSWRYTINRYGRVINQFLRF
ncbi:MULTISPECIES: DegQ family serine endoprotease [unclassified Roseitalea]|uniref:DegQ family serine endoprotease n=1 Tax=unclassified Roseitalea TaxID=2639107 RepID=UPI00274018F7|nr:MULTISPECIES: DegQ family serine endoprotease [unclassified Roseitalea]